MESSTQLYLASQSPRRRELLAQVGVAFDVVTVQVPEVRASGEDPQAYVQRLARDKARAGAAAVPAAPVLGADTLGLLDGDVLEKPRDMADGIRMLQAMSGRTHQVLSAVSLCCGSRQATRLSITHVSFRRLSRSEIERYWHTGEPRDKAGAYAIQGFGAVFVERLEGSYSGVVGLPLNETCGLLEEFGIPWWQTPTAGTGIREVHE